MHFVWTVRHQCAHPAQEIVIVHSDFESTSGCFVCCMSHTNSGVEGLKLESWSWAGAGSETGARSGSLPVCTRLATDLSLKAWYCEPWTMARILNETGLRAVLNYAAQIALAGMPQCHALALNQCRDVDRDSQKPKSRQRLRRHLSQKLSMWIN